MKKISAYLLICLLRLISLVPLSIVRRLARFLGKKLLKNNKRINQAISRNLALSLPQHKLEKRQQLQQNRLAAMLQTFAEMAHVWLRSPAELYQKFYSKYDNSEFEQAVTAPEGIIVLAPHIGNWEMVNVYLCQYRQLTAMYRPIKNQVLDNFVRNTRQRLGANLVPTDIAGIKEITRALKNQGMVAFLPDQVPEQGSGVFAPLFGHQAYTMTLAHKLALRTKAKVFIAMAYQHEEQNQHGFAVNISPVEQEFYSEDPQVAANCLNKMLEHAIMEYPEQNQWEYKRYRVQPNGEQSLYK